MIQESERALPLHRDEPQGQLRHLHRHWVDIHAVQAAVYDQAAGDDKPLFRVGGDQALVRHSFGQIAFRSDQDKIGVRFLDGFPSLHETLGQVAAALHQKRT